MAKTQCWSTATPRLVTMWAAAILSGCGTGYRRDGDQMVFVTWDEGRGKVASPIQGADAGSFVVLKDGYARDKWQVYFEGHTVWSAFGNNKPFWTKPTSFEVLSRGYAKDNELAYYQGKPFQADLSSFRVSTKGDWAIDRNDVYVQALAIHACEPNSFESLEYPWYRDKKCVYAAHGVPRTPVTRIAAADPNAFIAINFWFGADDRHVYTSDGEVLKDIDPKSFLKTGKDAYLCKRGNEPSACYRK